MNLNCSPASGSLFPLGRTTVQCTASDDAGNAAQSSFDVVVRDTTRPNLTTPTTVFAEAMSPQGAAVSFTVSADDLVDAAVTLSCTPESGGVFPLGRTEVTCSANDDAGNATQTRFDVVVRDTTPPTLQNVPADQTVEGTTLAGAIVNFQFPGGNDIADPNWVAACDPPSGSLFQVGATIVTCTGTDASGNVSFASFRATVTAPRGPKVTDVRLLGNTRQILGIVLTFDRELNPVEAEDRNNYLINARGPDRKIQTGDDRRRIIQSAAYAVDSESGEVTVQLVLARRLKTGRMFALTLKSGLDRIVGSNAVPLDGNGDGASGDDAVIRFGRGAVLRYAEPDGDQITLQITGGSQMDLIQSSSHELPRLRIVGSISRGAELIGKVKRRGGTGEIDVITPAAVRIQVPGRFRLLDSVIAAAVDDLLDGGESPHSLVLGDLLRD